MSVTPGPLTLFSQWKAARENLELAISSFNDATRALGSIDATQDSALKTIEAELPLLKRETRSLVGSIITLRRMRNSATGVWINRFPREILVMIFDFALKGATLVHDSSMTPQAPASCTFSKVLASVCWHWRCVSISTPSLWSQIDLNPKQGRMNYQKIWLERSAGCTLDLYLCKHKRSFSGLDTLALYLYRPHYGRIRSLTLDVGQTFGQNILADACSSCRAPPLDFRFLHLFSNHFPALSMPDSKKFYGRRLDLFLERLSSLRLSYVTLGTWTSTAFSNLLNLSLEGFVPGEVPSYHDLMQILRSSPNLHSLKLWISRMPPPSPTSVAPIVLENLAMMSLVGVPDYFVHWLVKHIVPHPDGLAIEIQAHGSERVEGDIGLDLPFCAPKRVKALCLKRPRERRLDIDKLLAYLPGLEIFGLDGAQIDEFVSSAGVEPRISKLRILELVSSPVVDLCALQTVLARHSVGELWVWNCEGVPSAEVLQKEMPGIVIKGKPGGFMRHAESFRR
ncbi:hypothetical protein FRC08_017451 [Ceratobasidium sp. 394]|nr:hypothetical protein FRC08_017451 [Ceratobasidium sp. 394]